ncbi:multicopper oxidase domain-containing protein [Streptomyces sp. NPDC020362]|uniref:multicopper oxidase domain-containing protein n=1 Tax=unclassified Streptomyces TaxID=2593676 RepID=UPI0033F31070
MDHQRAALQHLGDPGPPAPGHLEARPRPGTVERLRFTSDFHHPVHVHPAHFQVLSHGGRAPEPTDAGWKDTVDVRPCEVVDVLVRFRGHRGGTCCTATTWSTRTWR